MAVLIWEGASKVNGQHIGVFATINGSNNEKTGDSVQLWILLKAEAPHVAQKTGRDEAVCGFCPQRPSKGGNCYVVTFQGPNAIWRQWLNGNVQSATVEQIRAIARQRGLLRFGAYGDPSLIPFPLFEALADGMPITGYTHQWREEFAQPYQKYLMASVETVADAERAHAMGWRTFRVTQSTEKLPSEVRCPASSEAGHKLQCRTCRACDGLSYGKRSNIVILEH